MLRRNGADHDAIFDLSNGRLSCSFGLQSVGRQTVGNSRVPQPAKPVELARYTGNWYEQARYEASFQKGWEAVTAGYCARSNGTIGVINTCRQDAPDGPVKTAEATGRIVERSQNTKLKVSFFGAIEGDYWILDRSIDYFWSIVGEPSGGYLSMVVLPRRGASRTLSSRRRA